MEKKSKHIRSMQCCGIWMDSIACQKMLMKSSKRQLREQKKKQQKWEGDRGREGKRETWLGKVEDYTGESPTLFKCNKIFDLNFCFFIEPPVVNSQGHWVLHYCSWLVDNPLVLLDARRATLIFLIHLGLLLMSQDQRVCCPTTLFHIS